MHPRLRAVALSSSVLLCAASASSARSRAWADDLAHATIPGHPLRDASALLSGDFNGDGLADVAIVDPPELWPACDPCPSTVSIHFGPLAPGADDTPDVVLTQSIDPFKFLGGVAGDVNGDKIDDLVLGRWVACWFPANGLHSEDSTEVMVVLGRRGWTATRDLVAEPPDVLIVAGAGDCYAWPSACGDIDGDAIDDLVVSTGHHSQVWYGRPAWPAELDTAPGSADLEITGTTPSDAISVVDTDDGGALVIGNASLVRCAGRRTGVVDAVTGADLRVLTPVSFDGATRWARATTWRPAPAEPLRLVVTDDVLTRDLRLPPDAPRVLKLVDLSASGVVDLRGADDPPQVVGTILGAQLLPSSRIASSPGAPDALLVESPTLPRFRSVLMAGGLALVEPGSLEAGVADVRYGRGPWHAYGASPIRFGPASPVAVADLTGDGRDDVATWSGGSDGIVVIDGARRPAAETSPVLHVDPVGGDDARDGLSWRSATRSLRNALRRAEIADGDPVVKLAAGEHAVLPELLHPSPGEAASMVGQGTWLLGGYAPGGVTRDPERFPSSVRVLGDARRGELGRLAMGSFVPDAGPPAVADGLVLESAWLQGPALLSTSRIRGAVKNGAAGGTCDAWSGACEPSSDGSQGVAIFATGADAWIWNCHVSATVAWENVTCGPDCPSWGGTIGSAVRLGRDVHFVGSTIEGTMASRVVDDPFRPGAAWMRDVVWDNVGLSIDGPRRGTYEHLVIHDELWPSLQGTALIDADPLLAADATLSHRAAGQAADSPAIDAGDVAAADACPPVAGLPCLSALSTRTDRVPDTGIADLGFHAYVPPAWRAPLAAAGAACGGAIAWSAPEAFENVEIHRSPAPDAPLGAPLAVVPASAGGFTDASLAPGETAFYRVVGIDALGDPWPLHVPVAVTGRDALPPRLAAVARVLGCDVVLDGDVVDDCSGASPVVDVFRSADPGFTPSDATRVATGVGLPWADLLAANGLAYYRVIARDAAGNETVSAPVEARLDACGGAAPVPGLATGLRVSRLGGSVSCTFEPAPGATRHHVLRATIDGLRHGEPWLARDGAGACSVPAASAALAPEAGDVAWVVVGENAAGLGPAGGSPRSVTLDCR